MRRFRSTAAGLETEVDFLISIVLPYFDMCIDSLELATSHDHNSRVLVVS